MKRKVYDILLKWKNKSADEAALLIDGARRVGKSWIAEEFARCEYETYLLIDFNKVPRAVADLFENDLDDLDAFYRKLSNYYGVKFFPGRTLFIFDEVQEFPRARAAIKYLVGTGYHFLETGSLVSIQENVFDIVIPSEEEHVSMYPMDFEEFLWATGRERFANLIAEHAKDWKPMGPIHRKIMDAFREYLVVGGMPQAVEKWTATSDLGKVDAVKRRILTLYRADIRKHAGKYSLKVESIFDGIPGQLQKHEKKFRMSAIDADARMRDYENSFFWLKDAMMVNVCYNSTEPSAGLRLSEDNSTLKCYMGDTGLLVSHAFDANALVREEIHRRILFGTLEFNEGMLLENVVAQMFAAAGRKLFFYSRWSNDNADDRMEIDFLITRNSVSSGKNVLPVDVKSGRRVTTVSLKKFSGKFSRQLCGSVVLYDKDVGTKDSVTCLPVYFAPWL